MMSEHRWYVLHAYSGYEKKVADSIVDQASKLGISEHVEEVSVPTQSLVEVKRGVRINSERKIFPGYILIHLSLDDESYFLVKNTPGVTGFVSHEEEDGNRQTPVPLTDKEVNTILNKIEERQEELKLAYKIGETVRITAGPFSDFIGTVHEVQHNRGKVTVMVSFFGRETPVELDLLQAEPT